MGTDFTVIITENQIGIRIIENENHIGTSTWK